jgi:RND family efflux transporter MFP subunit
MVSSLLVCGQMRGVARLRAWLLFAPLCAALGLLPVTSDAQEGGAPAVVKAEREATLSSLVAGVITTFHFDEGAAFREGDVLVEIDCRLYQFDARAAEARRSRVAAEMAAREKLFERGGISRLEVDALRAELDGVAAEVAAAALRVDQCQVRAPFAGRVGEHGANAAEFVEPGRPVLSIVSSGRPSLEIILPAEWLAWVGPGSVGRLRLDAVAGDIPVTVSSLAPSIDPVSRTLRVKATIDDDTVPILPGMSGFVVLERSQ